jgi:hypothetical protein
MTQGNSEQNIEVFTLMVEKLRELGKLETQIIQAETHVRSNVMAHRSSDVPINLACAVVLRQQIVGLEVWHLRLNILAKQLTALVDEIIPEVEDTDAADR